MGIETRHVPRRTETKYVLKVMRYLDCMGTQVAYVIDGVFEDVHSAVCAAEKLPHRHEHNKFETGCWKIVRVTIHLDTLEMVEKEIAGMTLFMLD